MVPIDDNWLMYDYFPQEIGDEWIYQVDSIIFDPSLGGIAKVESSIQIREVVRDTFIDLTGQVNYVLDRYYRETENDSWLIQSVWHSLRTDNAAFRIEDNRRIKKLVFPPNEGVKWDGNAFFDPNTIIFIAGEPIKMYKDWDYRILSVDHSENINGVNYDRVLVVQQADSENAIEKRYGIEKYAFGIGLVYKERIILDTQNITNELSWEEKAERGFMLRQTLIRFN